MFVKSENRNLFVNLHKIEYFPYAFDHKPTKFLILKSSRVSVIIIRQECCKLQRYHQ